MKGTTAFEKLTGISNQYIEEAAEFSLPEMAVIKTSRWEKFSHFINSGWGVAMICCIVAVGVMVGIIAAGRAGDPYVPPVSTAPPVEETETEEATIGETTVSEQVTTPMEETTVLPPTEGPLTVGSFTFDYRLSDHEMLPAGENHLTTSITNDGEAFTYTGHVDDFRAYAEFIHSQDDTIRIPCTSERDSSSREKTYTVDEGEESGYRYPFILPADTAGGVYHLRLYYRDTECIFENVLTVIRNDTSTEGKLTSFTLNGEVIALTFQTTVDEYGTVVDKYLGSDGILYSFFSGTDKLEAFEHSAIREGTPGKTERISMADGRAIADRVMTENTMIPDLTAYQLDENTAAKNCYSYWYHHYIGSIESDYWVSILINQHGDIVSFTASGWAENIPYITEADIRAAQKRLTGSDEGRPALTVKDGVLCVYYEDIVFKPAETDKNGNIIGEDEHEHKFYYEEITSSS